MLKTLDKAPIKGKKILLRLGYDVTLQQKGNQLRVSDDQRIRATLPTIKHLLNEGCRLVIMGGWIGRPKPCQIEEQFKMDPVARHLSTLLGKEVIKLDVTVGPEVENMISRMKPSDIIMLENTRFLEGEIEGDTELAKAMARLGEYVVFDAFSHAHRVHASTTGILEEHKNTCCAGFLMEKEVNVLSQILRGPLEPFVIVLGGAKISDKIAMVKNIIDKATIVLIGGALANPFFKAKGVNIGGSLSESVFVDEAKGVKVDPVEVAHALFDKTKGASVPYELLPDNWPNGNKYELSKLQLPFDIIVAKKKGKGFDDETLKIEKINGRSKLCAEDEAILDIGPVTEYIYTEILKRARTIFWNGPMGFFEDFIFSGGTKAIAEAVANSKAFSIVGGGDTEGVVTAFKLEGRFGHVSTGGGASLALLAGEKLPVMKYLYG